MADDAAKTDDGNTNNGTPPPVETFTADDVKGLQDRVARLDKENREKEQKFKDLETKLKGVDVEEYKTLKAQLAEAEKKAAEKDPQKMEELFDRKLARLREDAAEEKRKLDEELARLRQQNKTLAVTDKVMTQISGVFNDDVQDVVKRIVEEAADLEEDGTIVFKDEKGDVVYNGAKPLTPKEFAEQLADKRPSLAKPQGATGTKDSTPPARGRSTGRVPANYAEFQAMSPAAQTQVYNAMTPEQKEAMMKGVPIGQL